MPDATGVCTACRVPSSCRLPPASLPLAHSRPCTSPGGAGYARVGAAIYAFAVALHSPSAAVLAYFASFVCDELDGRFARKLNQSSTFGAGARAAGRSWADPPHVRRD